MSNHPPIDRPQTPLPRETDFGDNSSTSILVDEEADREPLLSNLQLINEDDASDNTVKAKDKNNPLVRNEKEDPKRKYVAWPMRRHSSSSNTETISQCGGALNQLKALQRQIQLQSTTPTETPPVRPWEIRRVRTAPGTSSNSSSNGAARQTFYIRTRSNPTRIERNPPLKTCLKKKSKSAASSPPSGLNMENDLQGTLLLRRVKTVDFATPKRTQSLPPSKSWKKFEAKILPEPTVETYFAKTMSFPGPKAKSSIAGAAITRTDVHVVAISPAWPSDTDNQEPVRTYSATPTMQVVESGNGVYEVVWDDVPTDEYKEKSRKSSAGQALQAAGSFPLSGLERVNSKLADWSWGKGMPKDKPKTPGQFRPETVVFPEESHESYPSFECAVEDDEDLIIIVPPNSEGPSTHASRRTSGPGSTSTSSGSRSLSYSDTENSEADQKRMKKDSLVVPGEQDKPRVGGLIGAGKGMRKPPEIRRLSNLEEADVRFRAHRDSVVLARQRIFNAGGVSPELFMHRDSVSIAKRRMMKKNHAQSAARDVSRPPQVSFDRLSTIADSSPPKGQTAMNLGNSTSILAPQPAGPDRHIRIVE
ncbi:hypothetical protein K432DRAFT_412727 [Lepidopterella palustris CBS 459.81]|uniref:Uncharacterized protein n=1 Tax=Lepidopterella palustris CBS 459.81 TaxID=1314670 RepID=A0A8E2JL19_9PEZI|nr:hypothetical protein K432DRAFT_412727 [Lepidopterella palustris CBS 459.81]